MKVKIEKGTANGCVGLPASKSISHRMLIAASLCHGTSELANLLTCDDVLATMDCLKKFHTKIDEQGTSVSVTGQSVETSAPESSLYCRESGSTLRFLIPVAMLSGMPAIFTGASGLMKRPMEVFEKLFREKGLLFQKNRNEILVKGPLTAGTYVLPGDVSSQFISGLLFALPLVQGDRVIQMLPPVESRSYLQLTIDVLSRFGIAIRWKGENTIAVKGGQYYQPVKAAVEGDASAAAFMDAFNFLGGKVELTGLKKDSSQGDAVFHSLFEKLNQGTAEISLKDCPDLAPVLFAVAAVKQGAVFTDTRRLRYKESDRISAMAEELKKFGTSVTEEDNRVIVKKTDFHAPREPLSGHGDHRIVMALSVLLTLTGGEINGAEAVAKSYPDFFIHLKQLGIGVEKNGFE